MPAVMTDEEFMAARPVMSDEEFMAAGPEESGGFLPGVARSFAQGVSFGFSDEAEAATRALFGDREDGEDFSQAYRRQRDAIRDEIESFETANPGTALAAEIAGSIVVPGAIGARVVAGAARPILRGALAGAAEGAAFGAGKATEVEDIPSQAGVGALVGGVAGAVVPPIVRTGQRAVAAIRGAVAPEAAAGRRIGQAMTRDSVSQTDLTARINRARDLGRPAVAADFGANLRRELEVATQTPGPAAAKVETFLRRRNATQLNRLSRDLVQGTGVGEDTVEKAIATKMAERKAIADPLYRQAHDFMAEQSDDIVQAFSAATKTEIGKKALGRAKRILNVDNFDEAPLMARIDAWKQGVDDFIGQARRQGKFNEARAAGTMRDGVVELVDSINPSYRAAREAWAGPTAYIDAINEGRLIGSNKITAEALKQRLAGMTDVEKEAFRIGAVDSIITRLRQDAASDPNLVRHLRSPEMRDKLAALMTPATAKRFREVLKIEEKMFTTATQALKGSQTARRQAAMQEQEKQVQFLDALGMVYDLATANLRGLFISKTPTVARSIKDRLIARQNQVIAQRLLGRDAGALTPARVSGARTGMSTVPPAIVASEQAAPSEQRR